jgi:hypothetical protein
MTKKFNTLIRLGAPVLAGSLVLGGCGTVSFEESEQALEQRVDGNGYEILDKYWTKYSNHLKVAIGEKCVGIFSTDNSHDDWPMDLVVRTNPDLGDVLVKDLGENTAVPTYDEVIATPVVERSC